MKKLKVCGFFFAVIITVTFLVQEMNEGSMVLQAQEIMKPVIIPPGKTVQKKTTKVSEDHSAGIQAVTGSVSDYIIGPGDMLHISLWRDDALTRDSITVLPDGKIASNKSQELNISRSGAGLCPQR